MYSKKFVWFIYEHHGHKFSMHVRKQEHKILVLIMSKDGFKEFSDLDVGHVLQQGPNTSKVLREYQIGDVLKCAGVANRYKMLVRAQITDTRKRIVQCRNNLVQLELHLLKLQKEHDCHGTIFDIMNNLSYDNVDVVVPRIFEVSDQMRMGLLQDDVIDLSYDDDDDDVSKDEDEDKDGGDDKEVEDNKEELNMEMKEDHILLGRQYRVKPFM